MRIFSTRSALRFGLRSLLFAPVFFVGETCTKLTEVPHDALTTATAFHTDAEVLAGVAAVYAQLRKIAWGCSNILEDMTTACPCMVFLPAAGHVRRRSARNDDRAQAVSALDAKGNLQLHREGAHRVGGAASGQLGCVLLRTRYQRDGQRDPRESRAQCRRLQQGLRSRGLLGDRERDVV